MSEISKNQAKEVGLIDQVGTINIAKKELIKLAKIKKPVRITGTG